MDWYKIENAANNRMDVYIYDRIGEGIFFSGTSAKKFVTDLNKYPDADIRLHINSPGGSVFDGFAIYNYLLERGVSKVYIEGLAGSISSVIALAGDEVTMANNSLFMIHNPVTNISGDSRKIKKRIEVLDKIKEQIIDVYEQKTGLERSEIEKMMDEETWLTAQESQEKGFIDEVSGAVKIAAEYDLSGFENVPDCLTHPNPLLKREGEIMKINHNSSGTDEPLFNLKREGETGKINHRSSGTDDLQGGIQMEELLKTLGVDNEAAAVIKINDLMKQVQDIESFKNEITSLKKKLADANQKTVLNIVEEAIKNGKLLPAQKEWAVSLAEKEPELFNKYIENSENFLKKKEIDNEAGKDKDKEDWSGFVPGGEK